MSARQKTAYAALALAVVVCAGLAIYALVDSGSQRVLASFSTDLAPRSPEQRHNIRRAAMRIDGVVLRPGDEFSFNKTVGLCGVEQGYERAPAIVNGELRPEWGGGVCQVSSTLYNAALLVGLRITERHPHSRRVSSVPPGRDAAAAFGIADLRFVNTSGSPIRICADASGPRLVMRIMGKMRAAENVMVWTETVGSSAKRMDSARRTNVPMQGEIVLTYRSCRSEGGGEKCELVSRDVYGVSAD